MKKIAFISMALVVLLLSACLPETPEPPHGVWASIEPEIVLYLKPEYQIPVPGFNYIGIYKLDGVETNVVAAFGNGLRFNLYDISGPGEGADTGYGIKHSGMLLIGGYRVTKGEIRYNITPVFQEQLGVNEIIFRRVEDYDQIDPHDWLPDFFPSQEDATLAQHSSRKPS
jgi:hypothetical protein